jgi:hypothetical protein
MAERLPASIHFATAHNLTATQPRRGGCESATRWFRPNGASKKNGMQQIHSPYSENKSLASVHRSWGFPTDEELLWLLDQGLNDNALWPISGATVRFDGGTFDLASDGERALTFRAEDCGEVVDLIAWQPRTNQLASWFGQAFCLGDVDDIFNPATYFAGDALHVYETPLQWLQAERKGVVIVRPDLAHAYLANSQRLAFSDARFAQVVKAWLQPPKPTVEIFVAVEERAAA